MRRSDLLWAGLLLVVAGGLLVILLAPPATYIKVGGGVPNLTLPILGGPGTQSIFALRGLPLLLVFLDTRDDADGVQIQQLTRLSGAVLPLGVRLIMVAVDPDPGRADQFLKRFGVRFQVLSDPGGEKARELYHIRAFPEGYLLEQSGRVKAVFPATTRWITPDMARLVLDVLPARGPMRVVR
jgi:hypothetical protein